MPSLKKFGPVPFVHSLSFLLAVCFGVVTPAAAQAPAAPVEESAVRGVPVPPGAHVTHYPSGKVKHVSAFAPMTLDGVKWVGCDTKFYESGQIEYSCPAEPATVQGVSFPAGAFLEFTPDGRLTGQVLTEDKTVRGVPAPRGSYVSKKFGDPFSDYIILSAAASFLQSTLPAGSQIEFDGEGAAGLSTITLSQAARFQGIDFPAATYLMFFEGRLESALLFEDARIENRFISKGSQVNFSEGKIFNIQAPRNKGP